MVTAIATIAVVVIAGLGLNSLRLAKKDMITRSKRESVLLSMERMDEFARKIIPANSKLLTKMRMEGVPVFVKSVDDVRFESPVNKSEMKRATAWLKLISDKASVIHLMNIVEAWSGYFTNRLADEEVVFGPCSQTFCSFVMQNYAHYLIARGKNNSGNYPNTIDLFLAWRHRLGKEEQGQTMNKLLESLRSLHEQEKQAEQHSIPRPLGLDTN